MEIGCPHSSRRLIGGFAFDPGAVRIRPIIRRFLSVSLHVFFPSQSRTDIAIVMHRTHPHLFSLFQMCPQPSRTFKISSSFLASTLPLSHSSFHPCTLGQVDYKPSKIHFAWRFVPLIFLPALLIPSSLLSLGSLATVCTSSHVLQNWAVLSL